MSLAVCTYKRSKFLLITQSAERNNHPAVGAVYKSQHRHLKLYYQAHSMVLQKKYYREILL